MMNWTEDDDDDDDDELACVKCSVSKKTESHESAKMNQEVDFTTQM